MNGVYCLANDAVYDQFLAFVKSFRKYNAVLPLTVIRFDDNIKKLSALAERYNFKIWNHPIEQELNDIGSKFEPQKKTLAKLFKKFSIFWGEYDTFLFWDSDVVIVDDLTPILEKFNESNFEVLYWDSDINFVYNPGELRNKMSKENGAVHMNTGGFGSKKGVVTIDEIRNYMESFDSFKNELWGVGEQPFLNYCFDMKRLAKTRINMLIPEKAGAAWYNIHIQKKRDGYYWVDGMHAGKMVAVHWAGLSLSNYHTHETAHIFLRYRLLGSSLYESYRYFLNFYHIRTLDLLCDKKLLNSLFSVLFSN